MPRRILTPALAALAAAVCAAAVLAGCTAAQPEPTSTPDRSAGSPTPTRSATADPEADAVATFEAWLTASRTPDADAACALMTPDLQQAMVAEAQRSLPGVADCAGLIEATAALYAAAGQGADHEVTVLESDPDRVRLQLSYDADGKCGVVVLERRGTWLLTEQSEAGCSAS